MFLPSQRLPSHNRPDQPKLSGLHDQPVRPAQLLLRVSVRLMLDNPLQNQQRLHLSTVHPQATQAQRQVLHLALDPARPCLLLASRFRLLPAHLCLVQVSRFRLHPVVVVVDQPQLHLVDLVAQQEAAPHVAQDLLVAGSVVPVAVVLLHLRVAVQVVDPAVLVVVPEDVPVVDAQAVPNSGPVARDADVATAKNCNRWTCPATRRQVRRCQRGKSSSNVVPLLRILDPS